MGSVATLIRGKRCEKCGSEITHLVSWSAALGAEDAELERLAQIRTNAAAKTHEILCGGKIVDIESSWQEKRELA